MDRARIEANTGDVQNTSGFAGEQPFPQRFHSVPGEVHTAPKAYRFPWPLSWCSSIEGQKPTSSQGNHWSSKAAAEQGTSPPTIRGWKVKYHPHKTTDV